MLGLKFADRTFRFISIERPNTSYRLNAAGAGLLPFSAKQHSQINSSSTDRLIEALDRALDKARIERGDSVVVLDGRIVLRTVFPSNPEERVTGRSLREQVLLELGRRWNRTGEPGELKFEYRERGRIGDLSVVDVWGVDPGVLRGYEEVVERVGLSVAKWDCDQWAITRLYDAYETSSDNREPTAVAHLEAESLEVSLITDFGSVGITSLIGEDGASFRRSWDPDDPEGIAGEIVWCLEKLTRRWPMESGVDRVEATRLIFTGSVEEPERLLAALVRLLTIRVEVMDLQRIFSVDESLMESPLIQSNLGAFALCAGGALAHMNA